MKIDQQGWLDENAVTCRVFKGRWSIRHCFRMYSDISDLKIRMSSRAKGRVTRHESTYNPCKHCKILADYLKNRQEEDEPFNRSDEAERTEAWAM